MFQYVENEQKYNLCLTFAADIVSNRVKYSFQSNRNLKYSIEKNKILFNTFHGNML